MPHQGTDFLSSEFAGFCTTYGERVTHCLAAQGSATVAAGFPCGKATQSSHGRNPNGTIQFQKKKKKKRSNERFKDGHTVLGKLTASECFGRKFWLPEQNSRQLVVNSSGVRSLGKTLLECFTGLMPCSENKKSSPLTPSPPKKKGGGETGGENGV